MRAWKWFVLGLYPPIETVHLIAARTGRRIDTSIGRVTAGLVRFLQEKLSTPYPPASAPFTYPAMRSGKLMRSITGKASRKSPTKWQIEISSPVRYATYLQTGTRRRRRMLPRPLYSLLLKDYGLRRIYRELFR